MKRDFLRDLGLEEEIVNKIMAENGKDIEKAKSGREELEEKIELLQNQIKEKDLKIDELAKSNDDVDGLKNKIIELQSLNEKQQLDLKQSQIDSAVKIALINSKAKNLTAVKSLLNLENAELDGDVVKGLEKQIEELKKSDAYLFNEETKTVLKGITPAEAQPNSTNSKPIEKMSYEEICAYMEANPNIDINFNNK